MPSEAKFSFDNIPKNIFLSKDIVVLFELHVSVMMEYLFPHVWLQ